MASHLSYSSHVFNALPDLDDARQAFIDRDSTTILKSSLRDLFDRHGNIKNKYGVSLLHKHFELLPNQLLVDANGTATPWDLPDLSSSGAGSMMKYGGQIIPKSWIVRSGGIMPYEFSFFCVPRKDSSDGFSEPNETAFIQEFVGLIDQLQMSEVLGLTLLDETLKEQVEITEGRANIVFALSEVRSFFGEENLIPAAWAYRTCEHATELLSPPTTVDWCFTFCAKYGPDGYNSHFRAHNKNFEKTLSPFSACLK